MPRWSLAIRWAVLLPVIFTSSAAAAAAASPVTTARLQVPAEVVVSSDAAYVKGSNRADRLLSGNAKKGITVLGDDGIPVVYGVRVHETEEERNEPMWRNARVIGNKLFKNDELPPALPAPSPVAAESTAASEKPSARQGRILSYGSGAQFGFNRVKSSTLPPFYYKSYHESKQKPTAATGSGGYQYPTQQSSQGHGLSVVKAPSVVPGTRRPHSGQYSGLKRQAGVYRSTTKQPAVTTTVPVYKAFFDTSFNQPVRGQTNNRNQPYSPERKLQHSYSPSTQADVYYSPDPQSPTASYPGAGSRSNSYQQSGSQSGLGPYQRPSNTRRQSTGSQFERRFQSVPSKSSGGFRFPSASSAGAGQSPAGQILSPGSYNLPQAATDFQETVDPFSGRPVNPDQFKIKQMAFQSVPGGPIVNIPVPIPNGQQTKRPVRKPSGPFSFFNNLFSVSKRPAKDRYSSSPTQASSPTALAPTSPSYYDNDPYLYDENGFRKPTLYDTITDPIRRLGENVIEFTRPVTQPFRDATERLSEELGLSSPQSPDLLAEKQGGGEEALIVGGLVAGAGALAGLSILVYANTVDNNTHYIIGRKRRSLHGPGLTGLLDNMVEGEDGFESEFLHRLQQEGFQRWSQGPCAKRIFCDFMTQQDSSKVTNVANKVTTFLSYLDRGEPDGLMAQARQLTKAIGRRECSLFSCGGDTVDPSRIRVRPTAGDSASEDSRRRPAELVPR